MDTVRLLIAKTGDAHARVRAGWGDYDRLFSEQLDPSRRIEVVQVHRGEKMPPLQGADMVLITGSPLSVTEPEPWVDDLADWLNRAMERRAPTLGVCYGHQLVAYARGGEVQVNPAGYELGTISVDLTDAGRHDPLLRPLAGDGSTLEFMSLHGDHVVAPPPGATVLAGNQVTPLQALSYSDHTWTVQFHPELTLEVMRVYLEERGHIVRADAERRGHSPDEALAAVARGLRSTPAGPRLLRRFVELGRELLERS